VRWWEERWAALPEPERRATSAAAILEGPFERETWEALCRELGLVPDSRQLSRCATEVLGWWMPGSLKRVVLASLSSEEQTALHRAAARIPHAGAHGELMRRRHRLLAGEAGALDAYAATVATFCERNQTLPPSMVETLDAALDVAGIPASDERRGWGAHQRLLRVWFGGSDRDRELQQLLEVARRVRWRRVEAWALRLGLRARPRETPFGPVVRAGMRSGHVHDRIHAGSAAVGSLAVRGRPWRAEYDRLAAFAAAHGADLAQNLALAVSIHADAPELCPDAPASPETLPAWATIRLDVLLGEGRFDEAWSIGSRHVDALLQVRSGAGVLNLALAAAAVGERLPAMLLALRGAQAAATRGQSGLLGLAEVLLLALSTDWPSRQWEDLARTVPAVREPSLGPILQRLLAAIPADAPHRARLQGLLDRTRSSGGSSP
jgi:hypothetical protein